MRPSGAGPTTSQVSPRPGRSGDCRRCAGRSAASPWPGRAGPPHCPHMRSPRSVRSGSRNGRSESRSPVRQATRAAPHAGARTPQLLRLISVHLQFGCRGGSLENPTDPDCVILAAQRAPLEAWIDEAAQELVPFVILGDFNRRIDRFGRDDHLRGEIDDGDPSGLDLWRLPFNRESDCNPSFPQPIGLLGVRRPGLAVGGRGFVPGVTNDPDDRDAARGTLSGHCPIAVDLSRR